MDNRNRDKMSKESTGSTAAGDINRKVSQRDQKDSQASFGKNIGRSENLESEPSRQSGSESGWSGSSRTSGSSNLDRESGSVGSDDESLDRERKGSMDYSGNPREH
jgi:hypothetical protein